MASLPMLRVAGAAVAASVLLASFSGAASADDRWRHDRHPPFHRHWHRPPPPPVYYGPEPAYGPPPPVVYAPPGPSFNVVIPLR